MADLIQEFFTRDLNEAEQEALSKLLSESPEAALSYEGSLERNYLALGLPQPVLPPGLQYPRHIGSGAASGNGWLSLALAGSALLGLALWKFWPQAPASLPAPQAVAQRASAAVPKVVMKHALQPPAPIAPQAVGPSQEGQELSVIVEAPHQSLVTVRILDGTGKEVRALYTGFVQPGKWAFQWDGLLGNGEPAQAGSYRIDVLSGETHLSKDIRIKLQPANP